MLGRGHRVSARRIQNDDAASRSRLDIDIVHAHAGAADHAEPHTSVQDTGSDLCLTAHNESAELRNKIDKLLFAQGGFDRDFEGAVARKLIDAALRNAVAEEYFRRR